MKKCGFCGLCHINPVESTDVDNKVKVSYFEKRADNYSASSAYKELSYYKSMKSYTSPEEYLASKFETKQKEENNNHPDYSKMYKKLMYGKDDISLPPISYNDLKSFSKINKDEFMMDFISPSYSMKKSDYIKQVAKSISSQSYQLKNPIYEIAQMGLSGNSLPFLPYDPTDMMTQLRLPSASIPKPQLYINAELFGYIKLLASEGKLGFWDLFRLQQIHDFPLIDDIKNTPEPSDDMIYQVTI